MIDRKWLKENTEKCILSFCNRPVLTMEQQGIMNVLQGTMVLLEDVEVLLENMRLGHNAIKANKSFVFSDDDTWWYICDACKNQIDISDNFCKHCGVRIMHEEK